MIAQFEDRAAGGPRVIAFVHLTSDDLLTGAKEKPVTLWSLPEGVRVTSVGGDATSRPPRAAGDRRADGLSELDADRRTLQLQRTAAQFFRPRRTRYPPSRTSSPTTGRSSLTTSPFSRTRVAPQELA